MLNARLHSPFALHFLNISSFPISFHHAICGGLVGWWALSITQFVPMPRRQKKKTKHYIWCIRKLVDRFFIVFTLLYVFFMCSLFPSPFSSTCTPWRLHIVFFSLLSLDCLQQWMSVRAEDFSQPSIFFRYAKPPLRAIAAHTAHNKLLHNITHVYLQCKML